MGQKDVILRCFEQYQLMWNKFYLRKAGDCRQNLYSEEKKNKKNCELTWLFLYINLIQLKEPLTPGVPNAGVREAACIRSKTWLLSSPWDQCPFLLLLRPSHFLNFSDILWSHSLLNKPVIAFYLFELVLLFASIETTLNYYVSQKDATVFVIHLHPSNWELERSLNITYSKCIVSQNSGGNSNFQDPHVLISPPGPQNL